MLPFSNIKHIYKWGEPGIFHFYDVAFCREHWSGLLSFSTSFLPLDDKSKAIGATPSPWSVWLHKWPNSHQWDEMSGRIFLSKERVTERTAGTILLPAWKWSKYQDGWGERSKNMGLCWLELLIQLALEHTLQQDFHLCGDHKFSYCLSHLNWGFYYLQLEASSLINYS